MTKFDSWRIVWYCGCFFGNLFNLAARDEQKLSLAINEASDEPGTGNPVNVNVRAGNPFHGCFSFWVS
jgi:hypothetical protein